jgi:5-methylcytosine-specific restriction protein A
MPIAPPTPCRQPGCVETVKRPGYCVTHTKAKRKQSSIRRGSAHERGYGIRWQVARVAHIREHPLCVRCQAKGVTTAANVVDHIEPHKGDQTLFWNRDNWMSLCKPCHDRKTATEDGGFGR